LLISRTYQGEAHEAAGAFEAAAAQYALNVEALEELLGTQDASDDDDDDEYDIENDTGIHTSVARLRLCEQLGFHALALKRGGRFAPAEAAYERALAALHGIRSVVCAQERESMRIDLTQKLLTLHEARSGDGDDATYAATFKRLFREHAATLEEAAEGAAGGSALIFETGWGPRKEFSASGPRSRRRFVSRIVDDPARPYVRWRIVEVPYAPEHGPRSMQPHEVQQQEAVAGPFNDLARAHALPRVSRACGACGAQRGAALKVCQACRQTHCCDAACQRRHWKQHRAACRAAAAQNEARA
jgi:hypothetical protein